MLVVTHLCDSSLVSVASCLGLCTASLPGRWPKCRRVCVVLLLCRACSRPLSACATQRRSRTVKIVYTDVVSLPSCVSRQHTYCISNLLLFRPIIASPHVIRLTYPPLMAGGLPIRPVQNDLTSPVPVPKSLSRTTSGITMALTPTPRALFFDVFGTCVDWRTTVVRELHAQSHAALNSATASLASAVRLRASDMTIEHWGVFAQQWRDSYKQFTRQLAQDPTIAWVSVDEHHLEALRKLMTKWQIEGLWDDEQLRSISLVWHRLEPWTDSAMGVALLNRLFCISPHSSFRCPYHH